MDVPPTTTSPPTQTKPSPTLSQRKEHGREQGRRSHHRSTLSSESTTSNKSLRESLIHETYRNLSSGTNTYNAERTTASHCCHYCLHYQQSPDMPWQHEVLLTPYEKWIFYRVVPVKVILHLLLCILCLFVVVTTIQQDGQYYRNTRAMFCNRVMPEGTKQWKN